MSAHLDELTALEDQGEFGRRHIGPSEAEIAAMLRVVGAGSLEELAARTVPAAILGAADLSALPPPATEAEAIAELRALAGENRVMTSLIGLGYHGTHTPPVILRNVLENPGWYTAYTPYQAEIAQGRLEALVNFQTMIADLAGLPVANASLLDEATAAAEAMHLAQAAHRGKSTTLLAAADLHPQTLAVVRVRAEPLGVTVVVAPPADVAARAAAEQPFAVLLQYPGTTGEVRDLTPEIAAAHAAGALAIVAADPLALCLLTPPGEMGADVVVGSSQRFGVPLGYGGPHAGFMAVKDAHKRLLPGRLVGVSLDAAGQPAMRLALQTREQHIRREKATSNICTAQVLPAVVASMYAVWHGPEGLERIASRVAALTAILADGLRGLGFTIRNAHAFDTLAVATEGRTAAIAARALELGINV
ncbi:MAG: glycine dehydrogenase (aminomethyl-transferring), partial [Acetobacteraceae bacterium]|nr:glycine dehydrogenase (aminomethyl-transferring) [Acetobacteraceae bacterium]